jgi:hypothetical protein
MGLWKLTRNTSRNGGKFDCIGKSGEVRGRTRCYPTIAIKVIRGLGRRPSECLNSKGTPNVEVLAENKGEGSGPSYKGRGRSLACTVPGLAQLSTQTRPLLSAAVNAVCTTAKQTEL